ncbi:hypothetical protein CJD36_000230 [Flavipsychrobacter stenotrophus]|uniref:DUF4328 domain-containing protein n=1 Tax=Flavipsychrobacter stenotrophus TaxID=2077091 RepID=A0A2S7SZ42_9BACT|nr:hypothetical protein [Flavipsychrobacter stenotrophus]PQJ12223.1 hypothetical protein CJD36_000230 [Flavipsychrobacter stenotrophus]
MEQDLEALKNITKYWRIYLLVGGFAAAFSVLFVIFSIDIWGTNPGDELLEHRTGIFIVILAVAMLFFPCRIIFLLWSMLNRYEDKMLNPRMAVLLLLVPVVNIVGVWFAVHNLTKSLDQFVLKHNLPVRIKAYKPSLVVVCVVLAGLNVVLFFNLNFLFGSIWLLVLVAFELRRVGMLVFSSFEEGE